MGPGEDGTNRVHVVKPLKLSGVALASPFPRWRDEPGLGSDDGAARHRGLPLEEVDEDADDEEVLRVRILVGTARAFAKRTAKWWAPDVPSA